MFEEKQIKKLKDEQMEIAIGLCEHPVEDFAKYKLRVGEYQGLQKSLDIISELLNDDSDPN